LRVILFLAPVESVAIKVPAVSELFVEEVAELLHLKASILPKLSASKVAVFQLILGALILRA
jgi:hypothetical protein